MRRGEQFSITVDKAALETMVRKNRAEHRGVFLRAQDRYREKLIELLDERLAAARAGSKVDHYIRIPVPVDYTDQYDAALDALAWEVNDQVVLDQGMFNRLVRNDWEWAGDFAANSASYLAE